METKLGRLHWLLAVIGLVVGYIVAGKFGLSLARIHPSASPVWAPTGIALAAVLLLGYRVWPAILLSAFVVNITTYGSFLTSLGIAAGNTLEGIVGGYLVNRFARGRYFCDRLQDILTFTVLASIVATTISATVGVTSLALGGRVASDAYGPIWLTWWLGDAAGALLVVPPLVLWSRKSDVQWNYRKIIELGILLLMLSLAGQIALGLALPVEFKNYPLALMYIPFLAWAAFRFGQREAVLVMLLLAGIVLSQTLVGYGPFARGQSNRALLMLQCFMGIMAVTTLVFAVFASERKRADHAMAQLAALVGSSDDAIIGGRP
jgi:integral membrane sensor domain MASE1